jgi:hypothetical protein
MATDYDSLIPSSVAGSLLTAVETESVTLTLGNTIRMPEGLASIPVVSALPTAGFVNPRFGGRKPATKIEWTSEQIVPEEIACALAIPSAFVDDAGFPVWDQVRPMLASAIARVLDDAVLFGNGEPASFPPTGVAGTPPPDHSLPGDAPGAISLGMAAIEATGLIPNGIASGANIGVALRSKYDQLMVTPDAAPAGTIYGLPVATTPVWDSAAGDAIVGDWTKLIVGVRQDIRFDTSEDAILQDGAGAIIANAFQDDLVAMRCYLRVGVAIGVPLQADGSGPTTAFTTVDWTGP